MRRDVLKPSLILDMIVYRESPKTNKEIPKINKPIYKVPEWKFIFKRSIVFYTPKTTNSWKIFFSYIPFKMASKCVKYSEINLTKEGKIITLKNIA